MNKKKFTEVQIVSILHQQEAGKPAKDISREQGISDAEKSRIHYRLEL